MVLFDDVLTSGKHFKVARTGMQEIFPVCAYWASSLPVAFTQILLSNSKTKTSTEETSRGRRSWTQLLP